MNSQEIKYQINNNGFPVACSHESMSEWSITQLLLRVESVKGLKKAVVLAKLVRSSSIQYTCNKIGTHDMAFG